MDKDQRGFKVLIWKAAQQGEERKKSINISFTMNLKEEIGILSKPISNIHWTPLNKPECPAAIEWLKAKFGIISNPVVSLGVRNVNRCKCDSPVPTGTAGDPEAKGDDSILDKWGALLTELPRGIKMGVVGEKEWTFC